MPFLFPTKDGKSTEAQEKVKEEVVGAIGILSEDHADNKKAIARAGGIAPIVGLLAAGTPRAQSHATEALASLGLDNVQIQTEITTLLVGLLSTGAPEVKKIGAALLWRLVNSNPSTQQEMANAGERAAIDLALVTLPSFAHYSLRYTTLPAFATCSPSPPHALPTLTNPHHLITPTSCSPPAHLLYQAPCPI